MFIQQYIDQTEIEHISTRSASIRRKWREAASTLDDFIHLCKPDLSAVGISAEQLTVEQWIKLRRWLPLLDTPLNEEEINVLASSKQETLGIMAAAGVTTLVLWLLRRRMRKREEANIEIDGAGNIIGDRSNVTITRNIQIFINDSSKQLEARPVLALAQPDDEIIFLPIRAKYNFYDKDIVKQAIAGLSSSDPGKRALGIITLREVGSKQDMAFLIPLLNDSEIEIRKLVADTLGEHRFREAIPALLEVLENLEAIGPLGEIIACSLLEIGDDNAISILARLYTQYDNRDYLRLPVTSVCLTQDAKFDKLLACTKSEDKAARKGAMALLGEMFQSPSSPPPSRLWSTYVGEPSY